MSRAAILAALVRADGAVLYWQVPDGAAWEAAERAGAIWFDPGCDCYVHPDAIRIGECAYTIPRRGLVARAVAYLRALLP